MKVKFCAAALVLTVSLALISCSDSEPMISTVNAVVVADFSDENSNADVRLSIACETISDLHRISLIRTKHKDSGLEWICTNPNKFLENKKNWISYTNFRNTNDKKIPTGTYIFYCNTTDDKETEFYFSIEYPEDLYESKSADFPEKMGNTVITRYVLYDEYDNIIYYGEKKKKWTDLNSAKKDYSAAAYGRICYMSNTNKYSVLMPVERFIEQAKDTAALE